MGEAVQGKAGWGKQCKERQDGEQYRKGRMGEAVQGKAGWGKRYRKVWMEEAVWESPNGEGSIKKVEI